MFDAARGPKTLWLAPGVNHEGISDLQSSGDRQQLISCLERTIGTP